jgi:integral membrane sensor domain MASE1
LFSNDPLPVFAQRKKTGIRNMRIKKNLRIAKDNFLLVLAYYTVGHLSMIFLATPPSNAAAIWPPAGIALAAVLVRGNNLLPAVFLGDLIIAMELFGFYDFFSITFSLMVGLQAMLSAWMGGFLVSITIGRRDPLISNRSIILFLCLAGPISQLLSSVLAVAVEFWLGMIKAEDIIYSMFTWWIGSSIGVILFAPLGLIGFGHPRSLWRSRIIPVALPMVILFLTGVWFFNSIKDAEQKRLISIFAQKVEQVHQGIQQKG